MLPFFLLLLVLLTESSSASNNGLSDELRFIHQEMGSLRDENHKQNMEIASLKETVQLQNKTISQHETTIKELMNDDHRMIKNDRPVLSTGKSRRKRPAQLIPVNKFSGERKVDNDQPNRKTFYGPPTNCSDLSQLGYTLNGFYMVKKSMMSFNENFKKAVTNLDAIYCSFKQEGNFDPSLVEKSVMPYTFNSLLTLNHAFHEPTNPMDEDVYFWCSTHRFKKDYSGVLTFDQPLQNKGNALDGKTGYFKAPKVGIYHFSYEIVSLGKLFTGNETIVDIYMNDALVVNSLYSIISHDLATMILQVTLKLNRGDSVCFKTKTGNNNRNNVPIEPVYFLENVKGFLLKPTFF